MLVCALGIGVGFDFKALRKEAIQGRSVGLLSMEERVRLAGGDFRLVSAPGAGTEIFLRFPTQLNTTLAASA